MVGSKINYYFLINTFGAEVLTPSVPWMTQFERNGNDSLHK